MAEPKHRTRFFDHRLPSLPAGRHTITVKHTLTGDSRVGDDLLPDLEQVFEVRQPRLQLLPEDVTACYPLPGAQGEYGLLLPHITLTRAGFPWLHVLGSAAAGTPWLALLLFRAGELPEDPLAVGEVTVSTAAELAAKQAGPGQPPVFDPPLYDDEREMTVTSVLVPGPVFSEICPTTYELGMLAHIREGGPPDANHVVGTDPPPDENDIQAVLVSSRFPDNNGMHVAHLVSLDGFEKYLDGKEQPPDGGLRLISLHSWAFNSVDDGKRGFGEIAEQLAVDRDPLLRHPVPDSSDVPLARDLLRQGGTALPQGLESGETTVGFYRGPFTALPAHDLPQGRGVRLSSAGEGLVYVEELGVYDTGYAVAFSLGRQLALADIEFRSALMAFRKEARHTVRRLLAFPELSEIAAHDAADVNGTRVVHRAFDRLLGEDGPLAQALTRPGGDLKAAGRRPAARTATPASLTADRLRSALADTSTRAVLTSAVQSELRPVQAWLTRLAKLEMVPFGHLVPDERLLPQESIRFFHSDTGWIDAAVDGALSVGVGHALDADLNDLAREIRDIPQFVSGVMIRSELIPNWPQTIISAFSKGEEIQPMRQQILGEDLLILLYEEVLDRFTLGEPPQGLHFGLGSNNTTELRSIIRPVGKALGDFPRDGSGYEQFLRSGKRDVLDIQNRLAPALAAAHSVRKLSSAQFALQMVNAPLLQQFLHKSSSHSAQPTEGAL